MYYINVLYFFSLIGFIIESTVYKINNSNRHSGICYGPFTYVYGFGVLALILLKKYCLDKLEIIDIAKKIDTYDTSILPYEDCCTIFLPKHPVINPKLDSCIEYENNFNYNELIDAIIDNIETININDKKEKYDF